MNITICFGPKAYFESLIPDDNIVTLTELAIKCDKKSHEYFHHIEGNEDFYHNDNEVEVVQLLVAYSDEYAGLSENAIQSFISFLYRFEIQQIYLQNPPAYIVEQVNKVSELKDNIHIENYEYKSIDLGMLKEINKEFSSNIIGQDNVKNYLLSALYHLCNNKSTKPIVLLFYGPSGVGKTETAKFLSRIIDQRLFRKQLSMFHSEDFSSYLFGGRHSQNCLARELLERESNIILFDEFDKPYPVFHSAFYQLFDEGVFEDKNYSVEVKKAIIICTSNYHTEEEARAMLGDPIFYRFDSVICFSSLSTDSIIRIINNEYSKQYDQLSDNERKIVDDYSVIDRVLSISNKLKNARQISRIISEAISCSILNDLLS